MSGRSAGHQQIGVSAQTRAATPICPRFDVTISASECIRISAIAEGLQRNNPVLSASTVFGANVKSGLSRSPALLIGDHSEISLMGGPEESDLDYRIGLLADDGDLVAIGSPRCNSYENYIKRVLGMTDLTVLSLNRPGLRKMSGLAQRCREDEESYATILETARAAGELSLVPHITTGHIWELGRAIAEDTGAPVSICGPPPRLSRSVNDKLWFADQVGKVLGRSSMPPTFRAYGPAALAAHVRRLADEWDRVVVKVPDSAGSAGNLALDAKQLRGRPLRLIRNRIVALMRSLGWRELYPLLVEVWDCDVVASPSIQIWIPNTTSGLPIVEGIFEQVVEGEQGEFVGAAQAQLPADCARRMTTEAVKLAYLFQQLGYFGRCSFDAVLVGRNRDDAELHWIECNGRWGGVSVPMTLVNRLAKTPKAVEYVIVQRNNLDMQPRRFEDILNLLADLLYEPERREDGIILLTPTMFERGNGMHYMSLASNLDEARMLVTHASELLTAH